MSGEYCTTLPELAKEAAKSPYGGITGRPRALRGYLMTPDGKRYYLGDIAVMLDGYGDGCISEVDLMIKAEMLEPEEELRPTKEEGASGIDNVHAAVSIIGRESLSKQCWECANCNEPTAGRDGSKFRCAFLGKDFGTWHYDVPNECPCKGKGWMPTKKEGGAK